MRDVMLIVPEEKTTWCLDIDVIDGRPKMVQYERNTQDQRAAVSAYMFRGTVPGKPDLGVNWADLYSGTDETLVTIDNEVKQSIQRNAATPDGPNSTYVPMYKSTEEGIALAIFQE